MNEPVKLNTFPSSSTEALALIYVQAQDLTGKSPSEVFTMYQEAMYEMRAEYKRKNNSGWFKSKNEELRQV